jgi:hypothetical protein
MAANRFGIKCNSNICFFRDKICAGEIYYWHNANQVSTKPSGSEFKKDSPGLTFGVESEKKGR